jgi:uncharacterized membrane protein YbhN (UPF0104 family)
LSLPTDEQRKRRQGRIAVVGKAILAGGLLTLLVHFVDGRELVAVLLRANPLLVLAALLLWPVNFALEARNWHDLARRVQTDVGKREAAGSVLAGYALGFFTPGRLGELAGRSFYLAHDDKWSLTALVMAERLVKSCVAVGLGIVPVAAFIYLARPQPSGLFITALIIAMLGTTLMLWICISPARAWIALRQAIPWSALHDRASVLGSLDGALMGTLLAREAVRWMVYCSQLALLFGALAPSAEAGVILLGSMVVFFAMFVVPVATIMDLGVREGAAVLVMGTMGLDQAAALGAALLLFAINLVLPTLAGTPLVLRLNKGGSGAPTPSVDIAAGEVA